MSEQDDLMTRMRALAETGHPRAAELREHADALDTQLNAWEKGNPMRLLGVWARARRLWCECTGEPLL